ncbi:MAG: hypothetical protein ACE366_31895 [Bradymonadia bacterium]
MSPWRTPTVLGFIGLLVVIYFLLFSAGCNGYGYAGHGGYHHGPSFWYWGGVRTYHDPSVRSGSRSGPSHSGGGVHGGK